jgi:hypothetical protein
LPQEHVTELPIVASRACYRLWRHSMPTPMSREARAELLASLRQRYLAAPKADKTKALDEFVAAAGCHRKHAIRLLTTTTSHAADPAPIDRRTYGEAVREALLVLWEAADRICGKRLQAALPGLVEALERHGHLALAPDIREQILAVSAATIDRLLSPARGPTPRRKRRRASPQARKQVPVRTFADWGDAQPGSLEVDMVAHCGGSLEGNHLWSLVATDVCSGWTEAVPLMAREQSLVAAGLDAIRRQFPVPVLAIDTDNDSAFINETLIAYCSTQQLEFSRSRAYRKNDQAWIEQKNGAVVRRFVGYDRYNGMVAGQCLGRLFQAVRLYVNYFQPSAKLKSKTRVGARVKKTYHKPATPCERLLAHPSVTVEAKERLQAERAKLDPLDLLHQARECQSALAALRSGDAGEGPGRESLAEFFAKLPELWRHGEARPTHRAEPARARLYRTRADPFAGVWAEILLWLQAEPEATAKSLLGKLEEKYPGKYESGQLRTLQRRVKEWRRVLARELVYGRREGEDGSEESVIEEDGSAT